MPVKDKEIDQDFIYFAMGYFFHFTPEEVNKMDVPLIESMLYQLQLMKKKENDAIKTK